MILSKAKLIHKYILLSLKKSISLILKKGSASCSDPNLNDKAKTNLLFFSYIFFLFIELRKEDTDKPVDSPYESKNIQDYQEWNPPNKYIFPFRSRGNRCVDIQTLRSRKRLLCTDIVLQDIFDSTMKAFQSRGRCFVSKHRSTARSFHHQIISSPDSFISTKDRDIVVVIRNDTSFESPFFF